MANGKRNDACSNQRKALQAISSEANLKLAEIAPCFRNPPRHGSNTLLV